MQASLKEGRMTRPATQPASAPAAPAAPPAARSRRRGEVLEAALLDAAWAELQAVGYAGLTMEAVADRAGTSRAVLYRRWRNRPELVIAAMRRHRPMLSGEIPRHRQLARRRARRAAPDVEPADRDRHRDRIRPARRVP